MYGDYRGSHLWKVWGKVMRSYESLKKWTSFLAFVLCWWHGLTCQGWHENYRNINETLNPFCDLSGQKVSLIKSKVYFSPNVDQDHRRELCEVLGMNSTPNLGKYLGFLLKIQVHPPKISTLLLRESKTSPRVGNLISYLYLVRLFYPKQSFLPPQPMSCKVAYFLKESLTG